MQVSFSWRCGGADSNIWAGIVCIGWYVTHPCPTSKRTLKRCMNWWCNRTQPGDVTSRWCGGGNTHSDMHMGTSGFVTSKESLDSHNRTKHTRSLLLLSPPPCLPPCPWRAHCGARVRAGGSLPRPSLDQTPSAGTRRTRAPPHRSSPAHPAAPRRVACRGNNYHCSNDTLPPHTWKTRQTTTNWIHRFLINAYSLHCIIKLSWGHGQNVCPVHVVVEAAGETENRTTTPIVAAVTPTRGEQKTTWPGRSSRTLGRERERASRGDGEGLPNAIRSS